MRKLSIKAALLAVSFGVALSAPLGSAPLGGFVQGELDLVIQDLDGCAEGILYSVPAGKRLVIEWVSAEAFEFAATNFAPVTLAIKTWLVGQQVTHQLPSIESARICSTCLIGRGSMSAQVTIYNQPNRNVRILACRDNDSDETGVNVRFHGRLFPG